VAPDNTNTIQFPYRRSLGPVFGAFMNGLTQRRITGIRCGERVLVPPLEWNPETGEALDHELVEVGPVGTVTSWTWVAEPTVQHPLDRPFAFALIRLDGADSTLLHAVDAGSPDALEAGTRVAPRWRAQRSGRIDDIECFVPGEDPEIPEDDAGPPAEPVTMMDFGASITYRETVSPNALRAIDASRSQRLIGFRCPVCGRTYTGGRGFCPVDAVELGPDHEVELPQTGTVTNFTIVTPVQYPGQTETEPFVRAMVLLDTRGDTSAAGGPGDGDRSRDVILTYQPLLEARADDVRVGMRVSARWQSPDGPAPPSGGMGGTIGYLAGWVPSGEPDVDDPDLVNRIF
jgi:uncharacterized OB-fold protein